MTDRGLAKVALLSLAFAAAGCKGCSCGAANEEGESSSELAEPLGPNEPVNATPLPTSAILDMVNPEKLPIYSGPTAVLEGIVTVTGDEAPKAEGLDFSRCPEGQAVYGKTFREGEKRPDGSRPLMDALVVVTGYAGYVVPERRANKRIHIDHCAYSTRTIDLTFGQALLVQNADPMKKMYAPELLSSPMPALMVAPANADPVKLYSKKPGYTQLQDRMGPPWMVADVYTLLQSLHAVTDKNGHYRIDGVPTQEKDGKPISGLQVNVRLKAINRDVTKPVPEVKADKSTKVDVQLEYHYVPPAAVDAAPAPTNDASGPTLR